MANKKFTLLLPSLIVALFIILLVMGLTNKNDNGQLSMQPKALPEFQLPALQTTKMLTRSLFTEIEKGEYALLNVWASWCVVCKAEHLFLLTLAEQGVVIIGLNYRDNQQSAISLLASTGNPYQQVIFDTKGQLALDLGVVGTPESYLVDSNGMVVARYNGVLDNDVWDTHFHPVLVSLTDNQE